MSPRGPVPSPRPVPTSTPGVLPRAVGSPARRDPLTLQGLLPLPFLLLQEPSKNRVSYHPLCTGRYCEPGLCFEPLNPHGTWIKETQPSAPAASGDQRPAPMQGRCC